MEGNQKIKTVMRVSWISIAVNTALAALKMLAGILSSSFAMVSDAINSASDVGVNVIVMAGVKASGKKADKKHPYGHERFESVTAIILSVILLGIGIGIGYAGIVKIIEGQKGGVAVPGIFAMVAALISMAAKETMFWYTRAAAKKTGSDALRADAWNHRADVLCSLGGFIGILGARLGFVMLDAVASLVICLFIIRAAIGVFIDAVKKMTDESCDCETEQQIRQTVLGFEEVLRISLLKTRKFGDRVYVEIEIDLDAQLSFKKAHDIQTDIHNLLEASLGCIKHCTIHANAVNTVNPKMPE